MMIMLVMIPVIKMIMGENAIFRMLSGNDDPTDNQR